MKNLTETEKLLMQTIISDTEIFAMLFNKFKILLNSAEIDAIHTNLSAHSTRMILFEHITKNRK